MRTKIIQVIPIDGMCVVYEDKKIGEFKAKVPLLILCEGEEEDTIPDITPLVGDELGIFSDPTKTSNFVRFEYEECEGDRTMTVERTKYWADVLSKSQGDARGIVEEIVKEVGGQITET